MNDSFSDADLEQRRTAARRLAWLLCVVVLAVYIVGLFIKR